VIADSEWIPFRLRFRPSTNAKQETNSCDPTPFDC